MDNHCALDVGHLNEGIRSFEVRRPKCEEVCPEVLIREGPEELTFRAEEVNTQISCINVDHIAQDRSLHSAGRSTKVLKVETGRNEHCKEMSGVAGAKKPNETRKPRALWKMKQPKTGEIIFTTQNAKTTFW